MNERRMPGLVKALDATRREISFVASADAEDLEGDTISQRGWDLQSYLVNPVVLLDHNREVVIGHTTALSVEPRAGGLALIGRAELLPPGVSPRADTAWGEIEHGSRRGVSVGFLVQASEPRPRADGRMGQHITKARLLEISSVSVPACPSCLIEAKAAGAGRVDVDVDELRRVAREVVRTRFREIVAAEVGRALVRARGQAD